MIVFSYIAAIAIAIGATTARNCQNLTIEVRLSVENNVFNVTVPENNIEVANLVLDVVRQQHNITQEHLEGKVTIEDEYSITATYCTPDTGPGEVTQLLTHGMGFDRSYWDGPWNAYNYSYINVALSRGFNTLTWDRLGYGTSTHPNPLTHTQGTLNLASLISLTTLLRSGQIPSIPIPEKLIHIGHSFGSTITYSLSLVHPSLSDGLILTGFSHEPLFRTWFRMSNNLVDAQSLDYFSTFPHGYFAAASRQAIQYSFFAPGQFDEEILEKATREGMPIVTVGELLSLGGETGMPSPFKGPVLIMTGERDLPFCGGDCNIPTNTTLGPNILSRSKDYFPNTSYLKLVIVPGAGHGLNFESSHPFTYETIQDFLNGHGF